ncbi:hypothetical protein QYM36_002142 [Artemia franciscana]|uniref:DUF4371 domain-containing protein n=1 Tax=Artemia franciscana TaxID=6661 RepID=A0AA88IAT1_ARTSF|nr:hypothetical protein QYM36_002142 [Artemia franciscana]
MKVAAKNDKISLELGSESNAEETFSAFIKKVELTMYKAEQVKKNIPRIVGHDVKECEDADSLCTEFLQRGDSLLQRLVETAPGNTKYTSRQIQNELIGTIGELIKSETIRKVNTARVWCLIADESTDRQTRELMVVVCRYVYKSEKGYVIREDPVAIFNAFQTLSGLSEDEGTNTTQNFEERLDSKSLGRLLLSEFTQSGLDMTKCVGQGYDKAASMSSLVNGAAGEIKRNYQLVDYFHCVSHATNLSCSKTVSVPILRNTQDVVRETISHFSSSAKRTRILKKHPMSDNCRAETLIGLCTTTFVEA